MALLIYCYATGRFGSRTLEAATYSDVAVRYICANTHPDHDSICAFRANNETAFRAAFVSVLQLAQQLKLTQVGAVSVDGTKIAAHASKHAAVSCQRAGEMIAQLELEVNQLLERAQQAEAQENQEGLGSLLDAHLITTSRSPPRTEKNIGAPGIATSRSQIGGVLSESRPTFANPSSTQTR